MLHHHSSEDMPGITTQFNEDYIGQMTMVKHVLQWAKNISETMTKDGHFVTPLTTQTLREL